MSVPLSTKQIHTLHFDSETAQTNYFLSQGTIYEDELSYQRKDGTIRFPRNFEIVEQCNYVMYKNADGKWYYAFIVGTKYITDGMTEIQIKTDVIQTWYFKYHLTSCFVEREHTNNDGLGSNTVPEGLELGEYKVMDYIPNRALTEFQYLVIGMTVDLNDSTGVFDTKLDSVTGDVYNGVFSGVRYYAMPIESVATIRTAIEKVMKAGAGDSIVCMFLAPKKLLPTYKANTSDTYTQVKPGEGVSAIQWSNSGTDNDGASLAKKITKPSKLDGYTPRNQKLLSYPYCYLLMSNNAGSSAVYKYEAFNNPNNAALCDFTINGTVSPGMSIRISPTYYNGISLNVEEGLQMGKFPICSWPNDVYTNWLTQTSVNRAVTGIAGAAMMAAGVGAAIAAAPPTGGLSLGAITAIAGTAVTTPTFVGGAGMIAGAVGERQQHAHTPPQAEGNVGAGDVLHAMGQLTFTAYPMSIKKEYAKIIDDYFTMFGYATNRVKVPLSNHRENYWYTKTIDAHVYGLIPQNDIVEIEDCYNRGITFWRKPGYLGVYVDAAGAYLDNGIIGKEA